MKKIIFALIALPLFVSCKQEFHIYTLQAGDISLTSPDKDGHAAYKLLPRMQKSAVIDGFSCNRGKF